MLRHFWSIVWKWIFEWLHIPSMSEAWRARDIVAMDGVLVPCLKVKPYLLLGLQPSGLHWICVPPKEPLMLKYSRWDGNKLDLSLAGYWSQVNVCNIHTVTVSRTVIPIRENGSLNGTTVRPNRHVKGSSCCSRSWVVQVMEKWSSNTLVGYSMYPITGSSFYDMNYCLGNPCQSSHERRTVVTFERWCVVVAECLVGSGSGRGGVGWAFGVRQRQRQHSGGGSRWTLMQPSWLGMGAFVQCNWPRISFWLWTHCRGSLCTFLRASSYTTGMPLVLYLIQDSFSGPREICPKRNVGVSDGYHCESVGNNL